MPVHLPHRIAGSSSGLQVASVSSIDEMFSRHPCRRMTLIQNGVWRIESDVQNSIFAARLSSQAKSVSAQTECCRQPAIYPRTLRVRVARMA